MYDHVRCRVPGLWPGALLTLQAWLARSSAPSFTVAKSCGAVSFTVLRTGFRRSPDAWMTSPSRVTQCGFQLTMRYYHVMSEYDEITNEQDAAGE